MAEVPANSEAARDRRDMLAEQRRRAAVFRQGAGPESPERTQELDTFMAAMDGRIRHLDALAAGSPVSAKSVCHAKALWVKAGLKVINSIMSEHTGDWAVQRACERARDILAARQEAFEQGKLTLPDQRQLQPGDSVLGSLRADANARAAPGRTDEAFDLVMDIMSKERLRVVMGDGELSKRQKAGIREAVMRGDPPSLLLRGVGEKEIVAAIIEACLHRVEGGKALTKKLESALSGERSRALNAGGWDTVQREIPYADRSVTSTITPASRLNADFTRSYARAGRGVNCACSAERRHTVNLWHSELRSTGGELLFQGVRHGVHSAFGLTADRIKSMTREEKAALIRENYQALGLPQEGAAMRERIIEREVGKVSGMFGGGRRATLARVAREQANLSRARECLKAAVATNPAALEQIRQQCAADQPLAINFSMTSISLLTPDLPRHLFSSSSDERGMLEDQTRAWQALQQGPVALPVEVDGQIVTVRVTPSILTFNFGVNEGAVTDSMKAKGAIGAWSSVADQNRAAMVGLLGAPQITQTARAQGYHNVAFGGRVGAFLAANQGSLDPAMQRKVAQVRVLAGQIQDIWTSGGYRREGTDPYKLPARLAVLSHLLGETPAWNCKSGKDRTGELDAEAKFLMARIADTGRVPTPDEPLNEELTSMFASFALNGGNHEIQRINTGSAGFKLEGVSSITRRLGGMLHKLIHRGLAAFVNE